MAACKFCGVEFTWVKRSGTWYPVVGGKDHRESCSGTAKVHRETRRDTNHETMVRNFFRRIGK